VIEKDYILRLIQTLSNAIARIIRARSADDAGLVEKEVAKAYQGLMGTEPGVWRAMDSKTILAVVKDDARLKGLVMIFTEEASWALRTGQGAGAKNLLGKASDILEALVKRSKEEDGDLIRCRVKIADLMRSAGEEG
jgi:hypothetical protein